MTCLAAMMDRNSFFYSEYFPKELVYPIMQAYLPSQFNNDYVSFAFFNSQTNLKKAKFLTPREELLISTEEFVEDVNKGISECTIS